MKILVTGSCGFIGTNLCLTLLKNEKNIVYGIDNFTDNYNVTFKRGNYNELEKYDNFKFFEENILNTDKIKLVKPEIIIHLASIPGVRKSLQEPLYYIENNITTFVYLLEECKKYNIKKVVYASSSSVYGSNNKVPFNENDEIINLKSSYACSKKCMEVYGKYYNDVFDVKTIGLRFFTVYGERGRPDMAPYMFVKKIAEGKEILQFGDGTSYRDYTYVTDIVNGIKSIIEGKGKWGEIYNLGNENPINLLDFIELCEKVTGKKANKKIIENQLGDVPKTYADIKKAKIDLDYSPSVKLEEGLTRMYEWMELNKRISI
jgi:UDP-glucuronate 4-epimerase